MHYMGQHLQVGPDCQIELAKHFKAGETMMTSSERFHIACLYFATSESQELDFLQIEFSFRHLTEKY